MLDGERSHTIAFTEQCADHYTTNTIELLVQPPGIEPGSMALQTTAMTTSAKVALYIGGDRGNRTLLDSMLAKQTRSPLLPPNCLAPQMGIEPT